MVFSWATSADQCPSARLLATADLILAARDAETPRGLGHGQGMTNNDKPFWTSVLVALAIATPATAQTADQDPASAAQSAVRGHELMLNGFRAPSMGLEYRLGMVSVHAGAYPTIIDDEQLHGEGGTTWFAKAGLSLWFLPVPIMGNERSSFYAGASYLNDFDARGWGHSAQIEGGFRWVIHEGLFLRLGASALYSPGRSCTTENCATVKVRPNPGLGWAIAF